MYWNHQISTFLAKGLMGVMYLSSSDCAAIFQNCLKNLYWGFDVDSFIILDWRVGKSR